MAVKMTPHLLNITHLNQQRKPPTSTMPKGLKFYYVSPSPLLYKIPTQANLAIPLPS